MMLTGALKRSTQGEGIKCDMYLLFCGFVSGWVGGVEAWVFLPCLNVEKSDAYLSCTNHYRIGIPVEFYSTNIPFLVKVKGLCISYLEGSKHT